MADAVGARPSLVRIESLTIDLTARSRGCYSLAGAGACSPVLSSAAGASVVLSLSVPVAAGSFTSSVVSPSAIAASYGNASSESCCICGGRNGRMR